MFGPLWWVHSTFGFFWTIVIFYCAIRIAYSLAKNYGYLPKKSVAGEHIYITGGGSGIGRQTAILLSKLGARVTVVDVNLEGANETVDMIKQAGGEGLAIKWDVTDPENIAKSAQEATQKFGDVTILINNAGIVSGKTILDISHKQVEMTFKVNTLAHMYAVKEFLPSMIQKNHGHIVTISSAAGLAGAPGLADYCASKSGAIGFDEALRLELKKKQKKNIYTTCICPTTINTGMFKGVKSKYEWLMPMLDEKWMWERIVLAIRQNEPMVLTPFLSGSIYNELKIY